MRVRKTEDRRYRGPPEAVLARVFSFMLCNKFKRENNKEKDKPNKHKEIIRVTKTINNKKSDFIIFEIFVKK